MVDVKIALQKTEIKPLHECFNTLDSGQYDDIMLGPTFRDVRNILPCEL